MDSTNIIFNTTSWTTLERRIKTENNSIRSRIFSIHRDSQYVEQLTSFLPDFKVIANLRNGLWYYPSYDASCYFKSTDGHDGYEVFSLSRLNLEIALLSTTCPGLIIVDSTTRGKRFPDALRATIPIWIGVINTLLFSSTQSTVSYKTTNTTNNTNTSSSSRNSSSGDINNNNNQINGEGDIDYEKNVMNTIFTHSTTSNSTTNSSLIFRDHFIPPPWMSSTQIDTICTNIQYFITSTKFNSYKTLITSKLTEVMTKPMHPFWVTVTKDGYLDFIDDDFEVVLDAIERYTKRKNKNNNKNKTKNNNKNNRNDDNMKGFESTTSTAIATNLTTPTSNHSDNENNDMNHNSAALNTLDLPYTPIILFSCSTSMTEEDRINWRAEHSWTYIQGAGDDEENWSKGLIPTIYWQYIEQLLSYDDYIELEQFIDSIVQKEICDNSQDTISNNNSTNMSGHTMNTMNLKDGNVLNTIIHYPLQEIKWVQIPHTKIQINDSTSSISPIFMVLKSLLAETNRNINDNTPIYVNEEEIIHNTFHDKLHSYLTKYIQIHDLTSSEPFVYILITHPTSKRLDDISPYINTISKSIQVIYSDNICIMILYLSSDKKYKALLHDEYTQHIIPILLKYSTQNTYISTDDDGPPNNSNDSHIDNTSVLPVYIMSEDWGITTMIITTILIQSYPHILYPSYQSPTNAIISNNITDGNNVNSILKDLKSDQNNDDRLTYTTTTTTTTTQPTCTYMISKEFIKYLFTWLSQHHASLICSRAIVKEVISYYCNTTTTTTTAVS